ncbi:hypothetical protein HPB47_006739 [Ixodes persulcatus]|uniref:Uncharacterized protein n=1 Tax=Ixodes persulcatus TaxID=34615 RepID=A0AC60P9H1_IXOPE|nr:hypothetical protein HPB47_006739 [Ixodes persulcatus]
MATPGGQGMPYGGPFTRPPYLVPPIPESAPKSPQGAPGAPRGAPAPHSMPYSASLSHGDSAHVGKEGAPQRFYQGAPGNLPPPPSMTQPKPQPKQQPNGPLPPAVNGSWPAYPSQANGPTQKPPQLQVPSGAAGTEPCGGAGHSSFPPPPAPGTLPLPGATVPSRVSQGYHHQQPAGSSPLVTPNVSGYGPPPGPAMGPPPPGGPGLRYPMGPPPTQGPPPTSSSSFGQSGYQGRPSYPQQLGYSQQGPPPPQPTGHPHRDAAGVAPPPPMYNTQNQHGLEPPPGGVTGYDAELHSRMTGMSINGSFSKLWVSLSWMASLSDAGGSVMTLFPS